jgi:DNA polymerase III subunit delta
MRSLQSVLREIETGKFAPLYLLFGEESYLQEELINLLKLKFLGQNPELSCEKIDGREHNLQDILGKTEESAIFSERQLLIVENPPYLAPPRKAENPKAEEATKSQQEMEKAGAEILANYYKQLGAQLPDTIIIFQSAGVDRRKRIFKIIDKVGIAVECAALKGDELASWINRKAMSLGKKIDRSAVDRLLISENQSLHFFANELEKYATYLSEKEKIITDSTVDLLFAGDLESTVFKLTDALAEGNHDRAQSQLERLLSRREKPLPIFFMLVRHYRLLLQACCLVEEGLPLTEITSTLAVHPFVARKLRDQAEALKLKALEEIYIDLQKTDMQIKTGMVDPVQALRLILSRIDYRQNMVS